MIMPAPLTKHRTAITRKRRNHVKSRAGCGNCKLRRVKCDELRPHCSTCTAYGVICDFMDSTTCLKLPAQHSFQLKLTPIMPETGGQTHDLVTDHEALPWSRAAKGTTRKHFAGIEAQLRHALPYVWSKAPRVSLPPVSTNASIATYIDESLQSGFRPSLDCLHGSGTPVTTPPRQHFSVEHLEVLSRFQHRTALTIGDKRMAPQHRDIVCQLALTHPFLMEMLLGLTLMHDADLSFSSDPLLAAKHKHASLQHWNVATKLFNRILGQKIPDEYRDAIWATGVHLGAASFWYTESTDPWEAWPLRPSEPNDLAWMKLGEGKRHLWRATDPTRPDSLFSQVMTVRPCLAPPEWMTDNDISLLPPELRQVFDVHEHSTMKSNVYHLPVLILSRIQHLRLTQENALNFMYITAFVTPEFLALLEIKDVRAVFILGWWFKMLQDGELWWMARRAKVEGAAIQIWLQRKDIKLAALLDTLVPRCQIFQELENLKEVDLQAFVYEASRQNTHLLNGNLVGCP